MNPLLLAIAGSLAWLGGLAGWTLLRNPGDLNRRYLEESGAGCGYRSGRPRRRGVAIPGGAMPRGGVTGGGVAGSGRTPITNTIARISARLAPAVLRLTPTVLLAAVHQKIDAAGRPDGLDLHRYTVQKARDLTLGFVGSGIMASIGSLESAAMLGVASLIWQDVVLGRKARMRQSEIEQALPNYLDVIAIVSQAGASFRESLRTVADELGGPLAEEINTTLAQLDLGGSRRQVFTGLAQRNPGQAMSLFVSSLLQAEALGAPRGPTLSDIAVDMRTEVAQQSRRRATKAAGKISLVVSTLFLPAMMVLLGVGLFLTTGSDGGGLFGG